MADITAAQIKALREKTGAGMMECKRALIEADGHEERANEILRERGLASAKKKEGRVAAEGVVGSYIHMGGKVGVLVEVNCETDFVARGEEFQQLVKDLAMHIAAAEPRYVSRDEVAAETLDKERDIARAQAKNDPKNANKPDQLIDKIVEGRLNKFYEEFVLLDQPFLKGIDVNVAKSVAEEIKQLHDLGLEVALVVGGGNIFRGVSASAGNMDRSAADYIGMLATVMNAVVLQDALENLKVQTRVMSAIDIPQLAEPFIRRRAIRHLEKGRIVIFAAGTGNPFFSTDSAAALRALEIKADVILKATKVDGIYSADPMKDSAATRFDSITYQEVLEKQLKVMDAPAISLCMDNNLPIIVFNMREHGNIARVVMSKSGIGTRVSLNRLVNRDS